MKYTVISTYPPHGSKNIGDGLITDSTIKAIKSIKGDDVEVEAHWRADKWENVEESVLSSNAVVFSNLAIRGNMNLGVYPYMTQLLESGIPLAALSASTQLNLQTSESLYTSFPSSAMEMIRKLNEKTVFLTTRGYLSQSFCDYHRLDKAHFTGDIAFYDERYSNLKFTTNFNIKKIAISDPHYAREYVSSVKKLVKQLRDYFPDAKIVMIIHGINKTMEQFCESNNILYRNIYLDKENGLDIYEDFDLHVGYRVHGHVSTLKRRKPSYLLEQDGRGCDYGLTLDKNISVQHFFSERKNFDLKNVVKGMIGRKIIPQKIISTNPVDQIMSIVRQDANNGFEKFKGLEKQILHFNALCLDAIKNLP
jgi:hypothetical protein